MRLAALVLTAAALLAGAVPASAEVDPGTGTEYSTARVVVPMTFPVAGRVSYSDNWLACRSGCARMHMGQDLMGAKMLPLVAAFDGVVTSVRRETEDGGGNWLTIASDRGPSAGWSAIYVHVNNDTPGTDDAKGTAAWSFPSGIERGSRVLAGQLVGWLGDSGNAEGTGPHLHVELRKGAGWGGVVHNAFPSLQAARRLTAPLPSGPHPDGSLMRHPSGALFLLDEGRKRPVSAQVLAVDGRTPLTAVAMTSAASLGYPTGPAVPPRDGAVVRDPRGTTWLVTGGQRVKAGFELLAGLGRLVPRVLPLGDVDLQRLPVADGVDGPLFPGALVRADGDPVVSLVDADGRLHPVVHPAVLASHGLSSADVAVLPADALEDSRWGSPLALRDGTLVQTPSHRVAVVSDGAARRLWDSRQVAAYGYVGRPRLAVPDALVDGLRSAALTAG
ncbi:MAG: N-acetylmuramoyl-L-alanine amidase [Frankiales bacterium]|nr:N-acetylmuramoyl-L-alanine amidase [Frankiales bacterium]